MMSITLAVSIDYSLFILSRYREEIIQGLEVGAAVEQALGTAGHTVLVSGTTLAVNALPCSLCMSCYLCMVYRVSHPAAAMFPEIAKFLPGPGCVRWPRILSDDSSVLGWSRCSLCRSGYGVGESVSNTRTASPVSRLLWQREGELHLLCAH